MDLLLFLNEWMNEWTFFSFSVVIFNLVNINSVYIYNLHKTSLEFLVIIKNVKGSPEVWDSLCFCTGLPCVNVSMCFHFSWVNTHK